jgi:hypothetical protein
MPLHRLATLKSSPNATVVPSNPEIGNLGNSRSLAVINRELGSERNIMALSVCATALLCRFLVYTL